MSKLQGLQERRKSQDAEVRKLIKEYKEGGRKWASDERKAAYEKANADYNSTMAEIRAELDASSIERREQELDEDERRSITDGKIPGRDDTDQRKSLKARTEKREKRDQIEQAKPLVIQAWFREQSGLYLERRHVEACRLLRMNPRARELELQMLDTRSYEGVQRAFRSGSYSGATERAREHFENRAMSGIKGSTGANLIAPGGFLGPLEIQMLAWGGITQAAQTIRTSHGEEMTWPMANDTSNKGRQIGEGKAVTQVDPSITRRVWNAYTFTSDEILVPYTLMQDSAVDLQGIIGEMMGERLGRIKSEKFTTGGGEGTAVGIVTAATLGKETASATAISYQELVTLKHSVNFAYRQGAQWMFNDPILLALKLLEGEDGRPLWQSGMSATAPDTIDKDPYIISYDMASTITALQKTVLYGQLSRYKIREVGGVRIYRLQERHRENDQDAFLAFTRCDGNLLTAGGPVKYLQQHS